MKNYFDKEILEEKLSTRAYNSIKRNVRAQKDTNTGTVIMDLEGFNLKRLKSVRALGLKSLVEIISYYLTHGYIIDESNCLKKNFEEQTVISEETKLEELLSKDDTEKLKNNGFVKVGDLVGKDFYKINGITKNNQKQNNVEYLKLWFTIIGTLAGRGYIFTTDNENLGMISKGEIEIFTKKSPSEKEISDCSTCETIEELKSQLANAKQVNVMLKKDLDDKEREIEQSKKQQNFLVELNKEYRSKIDDLIKENIDLKVDIQKIKIITNKYNK